MNAHFANLLFGLVVLRLSQSATSSDDEGEGTCSADSLVFQGKCHSDFKVPGGFLNTSWFESGDEIDGISDALQSGRMVVIQDFATNAIASTMRDELRQYRSQDFELKESHEHAADDDEEDEDEAAPTRITMPHRRVWKGNSMDVCQSVSTYFNKLTNASSTKICSREHHLKQLNAEKSPGLSSFLDFMKSDPVQMLLTTLVGACANSTDQPGECDLEHLPQVQNGKIRDVSHKIFSRHTGDYESTNRGSKPGRMLSATYYLSDDEFSGRFSGSQYGGNLVWCTPFKRIGPAFNTLVLYRVSRQSWHLSQPVEKKDPGSRGITFQYKMAGGEELKDDKFAQAYDMKDFSDTMSPVELGAQIRPKKKEDKEATQAGETSADL